MKEDDRKNKEKNYPMMKMKKTKVTKSNGIRNRNKEGGERMKEVKKRGVWKRDEEPQKREGETQEREKKTQKNR